MELSIVLCTYNRAHNLPECIEHVSQQKGMDGLDWELLVVDNNSTDRTAEVVRELQEKHKITIRYVFEPEQGLSHARNRGIQSTESRYLLFIDDDILVEPCWLKAIYTTFMVRVSDAVGGRIWVRTSRDLPKWIEDDGMRNFLGHRDFGDVPFRMDGRRSFPFGGNMAFDRRIFDSVGFFDVRMGRKGEGQKREELFKDEETELFGRIADARGRIDYSPDAIVHHRILPHQLEKQFFRVVVFNSGYQGAMLCNERFRRRLFGIPLFLYRQMIEIFIKYIKQFVKGGPDRAFRMEMRAAHVIGMMAGHRTKHYSDPGCSSQA